MSEYQFYEYMAIDRPLTADERKAVSSLSSRTEASPYGASFLYHYGGSLRGGEDILLQYFDAFLYLANWGSARLLFRFPKNAIDIDLVNTYAYDNAVVVKQHKDVVILEMNYYAEEGFGWVDGEGLLSQMVNLRRDIMNGDMRAPYLMWLHAVSFDIECEVIHSDDITEPPIPPNLKFLTPELHAFKEFMIIEDELLETVAKYSPIYQEAELDIEQGLKLLSQVEKEVFLRKLAQNVSNLSSIFIQRLREILPPDAERPTVQSPNIIDIIQGVDNLKLEQEQLIEAKHNAYLDDLAKREEEIWQTIHDLILQKKTNAYDEAIEHLIELKKVATRDNTLTAFQTKISDIFDSYPTLRGLHRRLEYKGFKKS